MRWITAALVFGLLLCSGCIPARRTSVLDTRMERAATIACRWPCEWGAGWLAFGTGMKVAAGDHIRVARDGFNTVTLWDERAEIILGPAAAVVLEKVPDSIDVTELRVRLVTGPLYAGVDGPLGEGSLVIKTPAGRVEVGDDGGVTVVYDTQRKTAYVACLRGSADIHLVMSTVTLQAGDWTAFTWFKAEAAQPTDERPPEMREDFWEWINR